MRPQYVRLSDKGAEKAVDALMKLGKGYELDDQEMCLVMLLIETLRIQKAPVEPGSEVHKAIEKADKYIREFDFRIM